MTHKSVNIERKQDCCGCEACSQVCRHDAISMHQDSMGFLYPEVNGDLCVNCGLCSSVCPMLKTHNERIPKHTFAVKNLDEDIRTNSSSGGLFTLFAEDVIRRGGAVYGAVFDSDWNVVHSRIDKLENIYKLRGSKYVQSRMAGIYQQVKKDLKSGIPVVFSGCHCHIAALKSFLRKDYDNLLTIDVVCGGVPSPRIWQDYLNEVRDGNDRGIFRLSKRISGHDERKEILDVKFRDKTLGWRKFRFSITFANVKGNDSQEYVPTNEQTEVWKHPFMLSWFKQYITRPSCNHCRFRKGRSGSDYSLGDYWCIERKHADFSDDRGISLLLTYKDEIPKGVHSRARWLETPFRDAAEGQNSLLYNHPANPLSTVYYYLHDHMHLTISSSLNICLPFTQIIQWVGKQLIIFRKVLHPIKQKCLKL